MRRVDSRWPRIVVLIVLGLMATARARGDQPTGTGLFARDNLIAWCIVPFDAKQRGPEDRAAMLERLGFRHFAYDWRAKDIPTFDAEVEALTRRGIALDAFWVAPGVLNRESRLILDVLQRHQVKARLWVLLDLGADRVEGAEQARRVEAACASLRPLAEEAAKAGCSIALYNHGGWFGEPENQVAIIDRLKAEGVGDVGMVYNLHHAHDQTGRLAEILRKAKPYLKAVNLNGMDAGPDPGPRKILPLGQGSMDLAILRTIVDSGYLGPIGILGHTEDDAEQRLLDNLDGLDWLLPQLDGKPPGPRPKPRTLFGPPPIKPTVEVEPGDPATVAALLAEARALGDPRRGAEVFASAKFACLGCHKVGGLGGEIGPDLSGSGACLKPEDVVESILWPRLKVKEGYEAVVVATVDGRSRQAYKVSESPEEVVLRDPASREVVRIPRAQVESTRPVGTLMPDGLASSMGTTERRDLVRFLIDLGRPGSSTPEAILRMAHAPVGFAYDRAPLDPARNPAWTHPVNRDRVYDFYAKEADHFAKLAEVPRLLPPYPGPRWRQARPLGQPERGELAPTIAGTETDLGNLLSGRLPRRRGDGPEGGLRPPGRVGRGLGLLQSRDPHV